MSVLEIQVHNLVPGLFTMTIVIYLELLFILFQLVSYIDESGTLIIL